MASITVRRDGDKSVENIQWQAEELELVDKPNGPAGAALIGAGMGVFFLGLFTTWAAASTSFADWLKFVDRVGPLSGKTVMAAVLWLVSWSGLSVLLWRRNVSYSVVTAITLALVAFGFIGTFPKFFDLFAP
jgi:hypothetical protein